MYFKIRFGVYIKKIAMKKLAIMIILAIFAFEGFAQDAFDGGLKAGLNTSKIPSYSINYYPQAVNNYQFGAFVRFNFGRFYFQPEAYYNSKGGKEITRIDASTINSFELKTVDTPALLGLKIIDQKYFNFRILGGPVFSFATDKNVDGQFTKDKLKNSFFGWQYGAGIDFLFLTFDARMESYNENFYENMDTKNGTFVISLGIKLF